MQTVQPEFTQLDMEMSFMEVDEILELMEGLIHHIFKGALGKDIQIPFQRLTWDDAMDRFGSDKPDLRFGMELKKYFRCCGRYRFCGIQICFGKRRQRACHQCEGLWFLPQKENRLSG